MLNHGSILDERSVAADDIHRVLHEGDPTVGWQGDPELVCTFSNLHGWEVWEPAPGGGHSLVASGGPEAAFDLTALARGLAARDTKNRGVTHEGAIEDYLAKVDRIQSEKDAKIADTMRQASEAMTEAVVVSKYGRLRHSF